MKSVACKQQTLQGQVSWPRFGTFSGKIWVGVADGRDCTGPPAGTSPCGPPHRSFWSCLRTTGNNVQKFQANFLQPFSFLSQYKGKSSLSDLQEEKQRKRLKAMKQRHQEIENPPLNCRNGEGILHSPLLCFCTGSLVISAGGISVLGKQAVVARDTMISSEGSQLPSPAQCHSCCWAWGASAHACKITLFNFLFL